MRGEGVHAPIPPSPGPATASVYISIRTAAVKYLYSLCWRGGIPCETIHLDKAQQVDKPTIT